METFVETLRGDQHDRLLEAISSRGAFSRFKDGIRRFGIQDQWYASTYSTGTFDLFIIDVQEGSGADNIKTVILLERLQGGCNIRMILVMKKAPGLCVPAQDFFFFFAMLLNSSRFCFIISSGRENINACIFCKLVSGESYFALCQIIDSGPGDFLPHHIAHDHKGLLSFNGVPRSYNSLPVFSKRRGNPKQ